MSATGVARWELPAEPSSAGIHSEAERQATSSGDTDTARPHRATSDGHGNGADLGKRLSSQLLRLPTKAKRASCDSNSGRPDDRRRARPYKGALGDRGRLGELL